MCRAGNPIHEFAKFLQILAVMGQPVETEGAVVADLQRRWPLCDKGLG